MAKQDHHPAALDTSLLSAKPELCESSAGTPNVAQASQRTSSRYAARRLAKDGLATEPSLFATSVGGIKVSKTFMHLPTQALFPLAVRKATLAVRQAACALLVVQRLGRALFICFLGAIFLISVFPDKGRTPAATNRNGKAALRSR